MVCVYNRFIGFILVLMGVLGITGIGLFNGLLLGLFRPSPTNYLLYLGLGILIVITGFECHESLGRVLTRVFGVLFLTLAVWGFLAYPDELYGSLAFNLADCVLFSAIGILALIAATPQRYSEY